jgi:hypothetical protein
MGELTVNQVDVAKLKVAPGDVLLVSVETMLSMEQAARVKDAFLKAFEETGGTVPSILVIDKQITARVVRASDVG